MKLNTNKQKILIGCTWVLLILVLIMVLAKAQPLPKASEEKAEWITNSYYYKYKGTIITRDKKPLQDVDPKTFTILGHLIAKDAKHVYILEKIQAGFDATSFEKYDYKLGVDFFRDKNGIYMLFSMELLPSPLDPKQSVIIGDYLKTPDGIYFPSYSSMVKIEGIDAESFRELGICASVERSSGAYMADKNHVYVGHKVLEGVDPDKFKKIADITPGADAEIPYHLTIWSDDNKLFVNCGILMVEADPATFKYLGENRGEDANYTYSFNTGDGYAAQKK